MSSTVRRLARVTARVVVGWVAYGLVAMGVSVPVAGQQAVAGVRFDDRLGTLPVEVSLAHNGVSTLETGILGSLYWERTGTAGFGARLRATGPPEAGGTLASYVSPKFVNASAQFVNDPDEVARVYGQELRSQLFGNFLRIELWVGLAGGGLLTGLFRARVPFSSPVVTRRRRSVLSGLVVGAGVAVSTLVAVQLFERWDGSAEVDASYPMPGISQLSFSSPQTLEVARQVRPFIEKNTDRLRERAHAYETAAEASLRTELSAHAAALAPRAGERIVLAEADPQGSLIGTRVRQVMYSVLTKQLGANALALRTISGDVTSNGSVAEAGFVQGEATASPDIPLVVVKGDHDTHTTVEQLEANDVVVPDFKTTAVEGLQVVGANDPAVKALFGGLVVNDTGVTERELGANLRALIDADEPVIVLLHQPRSAAGYLGVDSLEDLNAGAGRDATPWDDGIPDLPPGSVNVGHLHDANRPWVVWNTDSDQVTWTVLSQLGTSGGVEENPTLNRFSTPFSVPLKPMSVQLQYLNTDSGLQTGYAAIDIATDGTISITDRADLGLPGGQPAALDAADETS